MNWQLVIVEWNLCVFYCQNISELPKLIYWVKNVPIFYDQWSVYYVHILVLVAGVLLCIFRSQFVLEPM